jgi:PHD/YefM family antitoxin component YafN of YafNO toxin-antitoxin module
MLTATELRQDIYQKLDEVIATQEPLLIERKGNILK